MSRAITTLAVAGLILCAAAGIGAGRETVPEPEIVAPDAILEVVEATPEPEPEPVEWVEVIATAYCPCERCCGSYARNRPNGIVYTASGEVAQAGVTIAADWTIYTPGTVVEIEGIGTRVVQDKGGAIKGNRIDIYFEDHAAALDFGRQTVKMRVLEGAE